MKFALILTSLLFVSTIGTAQTTWSADAAQVFYDNCTKCHNPNGIAPNSFMTYADAQPYSSLIQNYVTNGIMPPWTPDTSFQHFSQERVLTTAERDIILNWITDGLLEGDANQTPPAPVYNGLQQLPGTPDLIVTAPNYMSKATASQDDYVCFVIPSGLTQDRKIRAIEVIPGNLNTVHHCLVYADATNANTTDTIGGDCGGPVAGDLMMGYTPGSTPTIFPSSSTFNSGMIIQAGSDIVLAMHYPEGSYGTWDQTKIHFYYYDEPVSNFRQVSTNPIIQDWNFTITANTIDSVENTFNSVFSDFTMLSVFPHMHLIGKSIESYAITPANDTIPFVRIPKWDFEWQDFYWFEYMKKISTGSQIYGKGVYDNRASNVNNPNNPPIDISAGLNTSDEMFLIYYHYMPYQAGDENINVDSLTNIFLSQQEYTVLNSDVKVYPNPFSYQTTINFNLNQSAFVSLYIYDMQGKLVKSLLRENLNSGEYKIEWDGNNANATKTSSGIYFYSMMIDGRPYSGKIILQ